MYRAGDVIKDRYFVREVLRTQANSEACRCTRFSDGREITIECTFLRSTDPPGIAELYEERKVEILARSRRLQTRRPDWFEIEVDGNRIFHVIQDIPIETIRDILIIDGNDVACTDLENRNGPEAARALVKRRDLQCLEIELPPPFQHSSFSFYVMLSLCLIVFLVSSGVLIFSTYITIDRIVDGEIRAMQLLLVPVWLIVLPLPAIFSVMLFGRQLIIVTSSEFEIRRTIFRTQKKPADASGTFEIWEASYIDRLLRRQVKGRTRNLRGGEVETLACCAVTFSVLVLSEVTMKHRLFPALSLTEQEWLAREINSFLGSIQREP